MFYSRYLTYLGAISLFFSTFALSTFAQAQVPTQQLSLSQKKYLQQQINEQVIDKSALSMVEGWSETKKVAEFICRPFALPVIQKYHKDADKVFLGIDSPGDIKLKNASELVGIGMYRTDDGWHNIRFSCKLDAIGKARSFKFENIVPPKLQTEPEPVIPSHKEK
ncbi:hypothetical protein [Xenorhabdus doucetiae]|uniref:DUF930 domain-containing protein n=1 Tax=Xenorhabdus doucetiae TaxID=351671 RepID=A0A068QM42_9GAMM|nr:hypothetical protein [Xenorhabdus doucetiae]TYP07516.1 hypothetical protein LY16_01751 [Xenorhabdus doucetiae]CDG15813.1 conserved exported protein of unknown function [Xenorhabdus doucetiae]